MNIVVVDDERLALQMLVDTIKIIRPDDNVIGFKKASDLLEFVLKESCEIAFLDINMPGKNGLVLAKELKNLNPNVNIIFATAHSDYAIEAYKMHASGYLMKPVSEDEVRKEIENLRYPLENHDSKIIKVRTFNNFDVFIGDKPVEFLRNKSKEVFAYLIDRNGTSATFAEIAAILWEDGFYDRSRQKQLHNYIYDMIKSLDAVNAKDVIIKNRKGIMVDVSKIDCDLYRFLEGDVRAINAYHGEYMSAYSWAEFTVGMLSNKK